MVEPLEMLEMVEPLELTPMELSVNPFSEIEKALHALGRCIDDTTMVLRKLIQTTPTEQRMLALTCETLTMHAELAFNAAVAVANAKEWAMGVWLEGRVNESSWRDDESALREMLFRVDSRLRVRQFVAKCAQLLLSCVRDMPKSVEYFMVVECANNLKSMV